MSTDKSTKSAASSAAPQAEGATFPDPKSRSFDDSTSSSFADIHTALQEKLSDWPKWLKAVKSRKKVAPLRKVLNENCLFWALPTADAIYCSTIARLMQLRVSKKDEDESFDWGAAAEHWMTATKELVTIPLAVEAVAWAHALPALTLRLEQNTWINLLSSLLFLAQSNHERQFDDAVAKPIVTAELAMSLAYALPEIPACKKRSEDASKQLEATMDEMLDGEGMPHAAYLSGVQLLLATATRTLALDAELKKRRIGKNARLQFDWLCRQTLRWTRPDGSVILNDLAAAPHFDGMMKCALQLNDDDADLAAFKVMRGKRKSDEDAPEPAEHSEWACLATMRTAWSPSSARMAVSYNDRKLASEFAIGNQVVFSGPHNPFVSINGEELAAESDWEEVCWESDEDMDFVELDMRLTHGWRIQRQLLLAREDSFALISDSVVGPTTADIRYHSRLPLCHGVKLEQSDENTEACILGERRLGTVIPLSLSEWKSGSTTNRLRIEPAGLEIQQRGRGLFAPLFIDFDPARRSKALTWRSLTVAESLHTVASDVAVAFRIQIGKEQWAIYRSIAKPANRTFLGQNLTCEFLVGQFDTEGDVEPIIEVST